MLDNVVNHLPSHAKTAFRKALKKSLNRTAVKYYPPKIKMLFKGQSPISYKEVNKLADDNKSVYIANWGKPLSARWFCQMPYKFVSDMINQGRVYQYITKKERLKAMYHTVKRILGKPNDYKLCLSCGKVNWYENEICVACNNEIKHDNTMTKEEVLAVYDGIRLDVEEEI